MLGGESKRRNVALRLFTDLCDYGQYKIYTKAHVLQSTRAAMFMCLNWNVHCCKNSEPKTISLKKQKHSEHKPEKKFSHRSLVTPQIYSN